jgi:nucleotide-binding universal stress UspA family protein
VKLLLPIDDSACSRETIKWAARTFDKNNSCYYLLFVIPAMPADINILAFDNIESLDVLNKAKFELECSGCTVDKTDYRMGDAVLEICDYADAYDIDQVIIGTHGRSGLAKMMAKSIGEGVLVQWLFSVMWRNP